MSFESDLVAALKAEKINIDPSVVPTAAIFSAGLYSLQVWFQSLSDNSASAFDETAGAFPILHYFAQPDVDLAPGLFNFLNAIDAQPNRINISNFAAISTQALGSLATNPKILLPPTITGYKLIPKTMQSDNGITVSWTSLRPYDAWNIRWNSVQSDEQDYTARGGSYTCRPCVQKQQYSIIVEGGQNAGLGGHNWSGWSAPLVVTAAANYHNLRQFLLASNFHGAGGLRRITKQQISLRTLMGI